jgi:predicted amidohydrolase YtcJ
MTVLRCSAPLVKRLKPRTLKKITDTYGNEGRRDVLIHGQYVRDEQLDDFKELNTIASLFPLHTFYWGDWHK